MLNVLSNLVKPAKDTGYRIGFVAVLLISIALIYPAFYGIGYESPILQHFITMLLIGLVMSSVIGVLLKNSSTSDTKRLTTGSMFKQTMVVVVGLFAGLVLVIINGGMNTGMDYITANSSGNGLFLGLFAGVSEELFFRGFIQNTIRLYVPIPLLAIIPSALVFALFHFFAYGLEVGVLLILFVMGMFLGILHEIFNDIGVPMLAHIVNNTFGMLPAVMAVVTGNILIIAFIMAFAIMAFIISAIVRRK